MRIPRTWVFLLTALLGVACGGGPEPAGPTTTPPPDNTAAKPDPEAARQAARRAALAKKTSDLVDRVEAAETLKDIKTWAGDVAKLEDEDAASGATARKALRTRWAALVEAAIATEATLDGLQALGAEVDALAVEDATLGEAATTAAAARFVALLEVPADSEGLPEENTAVAGSDDATRIAANYTEQPADTTLLALGAALGRGLVVSDRVASSITLRCVNQPGATVWAEALKRAGAKSRAVGTLLVIEPEAPQAPAAGTKGAGPLVQGVQRTGEEWTVTLRGESKPRTIGDVVTIDGREHRIQRISADAVVVAALAGGTRSLAVGPGRPASLNATGDTLEGTATRVPTTVLLTAAARAGNFSFVSGITGGAKVSVSVQAAEAWEVFRAVAAAAGGQADRYRDIACARPGTSGRDITERKPLRVAGRRIEHLSLYEAGRATTLLALATTYDVDLVLGPDVGASVAARLNDVPGDVALDAIALSGDIWFAEWQGIQIAHPGSRALVPRVAAPEDPGSQTRVARATLKGYPLAQGLQELGAQFRVNIVLTESVAGAVSATLTNQPIGNLMMAMALACGARVEEWGGVIVACGADDVRAIGSLRSVPAMPAVAVSPAYTAYSASEALGWVARENEVTLEIDPAVTGKVSVTLADLPLSKALALMTFSCNAKLSQTPGGGYKLTPSGATVPAPLFANPPANQPGELKIDRE